MSWTFLDNSGRVKQLAQMYGFNPTQTVLTVAGSGTYTPPTGCTAIFVECVGSGGGSGGTAATTSQAAAAGGGGGGAYAASLITNPSASYSYTIGTAGSAGSAGNNPGTAGGDTTFGSSLVVAKGGGGGNGSSAGTAFGQQSGGVGGAASSSTGSITIDGGDGTNGVILSATQAVGGFGGAGAVYGAVRRGTASGTASGGVAAHQYGSGASGAFAAGTQSAQAGAAGTAGVIIITEFYGTRPVGGSKPGINFTSQDLSLGPPSNPLNGDIWYATNVDSNGTVWQFRYNAGSSSTYKWEFVGGPPFIHEVDASETTTTAWATLVDLTTPGPLYTVARAGDYQYISEYRGSNNTANVAILSTVCECSGAGAIVQQDTVQVTCTSATAGASVMGVGSGRLNGVAAGDTIRMRYCTFSSGTGTFMQRRMQIIPVRIA